MFSLQAQFNSPVSGDYAAGVNAYGGNVTGLYYDGSRLQDKSSSQGSFFEFFAPLNTEYSDRNVSDIAERSGSGFKTGYDAAANANANVADANAEADTVSKARKTKESDSEESAKTDKKESAITDKKDDEPEVSTEVDSESVERLLIGKDSNNLLKDAPVPEYDGGEAVTINVDLSEVSGGISLSNGENTEFTAREGAELGSDELAAGVIAESADTAEDGELKAAGEKNANLLAANNEERLLNSQNAKAGKEDLALTLAAEGEAAKAKGNGANVLENADKETLAAKKAKPTSGSSASDTTASGLAEGAAAQMKASGSGRGENGEGRDGRRNSKAKQSKTETDGAGSKVQTLSASSGAKETLHATDSSGRETEITVNMKSDAQSSAQSGAQGGGAQGMVQNAAQDSGQGKAGASLENLLSRELHNNLNGDIVRQADLQLRGSGEASINLALKPESLGNVKIRLQMAENKVTGTIVVESEEALRAFNEEIHNIEEAFRDCGFAGANIEAHLAESGGGGQNGDADLAALRSSFNAPSYDEENDAVVSTRTYSMFFADKRVSVMA